MADTEPEPYEAAGSEAGSEAGASDAGRAVVMLNTELCIGVGNCELLQPDHFRVDDDTAVARLIGDAVLARADAETVVDRCPSGALTLAAD